ncbi:MAG: hypothetical protein AAF197_12695 [Pseudomonadota bacterium]
MIRKIPLVSMRYIMILVLAAVSSPALAIKKCQDAEGNWHYGDIAVAACKNSKITTLNERGVVESERAAPKTAEQLAQEAEQQSKEQETAEQERQAREHRARILSIYETEDDILRQQDNQLYSVQSNIDVHLAYIDSMKDRIERNQDKLIDTTSNFAVTKLEEDIDYAEQRIIESETQLVELRAQRELVKEKFTEELKMYRELKREASLNQ